MRLLVTGLVLATVGALLGATYVGWWLHDKNPGKPVAIVVKRPIKVVNESGASPTTMPNVLGLDVDSARQAMADAGIDPARIAVSTQPYAGERDLVIDQDPSPGAPRSSGAVKLAISGPATMPKVVGRTVDDARVSLGNLGVRVISQRRFAAGQKENTVLDSTPRMGQPLGTDATLTIADAPSSVFVSQLETIQSDCNSASLPINGHTYKTSMSCEPGTDSPSEMAFALNRRVSQLVAVVGVSDQSQATAPIRFRVIVDGAVRYDRVVPFGQSAHLAVSVVGGLRVRLEARLASHRDTFDTVTGVWGNARFQGGRSAIDALSRQGQTP